MDCDFKVIKSFILVNLFFYYLLLQHISEFSIFLVCCLDCCCCFLFFFALFFSHTHSRHTHTVSTFIAFFLCFLFFFFQYPLFFPFFFIKLVYSCCIFKIDLYHLLFGYTILIIYSPIPSHLLPFSSHPTK